MNQYEGFFKNGDQWNGESFYEDGKRYFVAIDKHGNPYETPEIPKRYPLFTMKQYVGVWTEQEIRKEWAKVGADGTAV